MMSEVMRTYRPSRRTNRHIRRRRHGSLRRWLIPLLVVLAIAYGLWITRDTYPMARLTPRDHQFRVLARGRRKGNYLLFSLLILHFETGGGIYTPVVLNRASSF